MPFDKRWRQQLSKLRAEAPTFHSGFGRCAEGGKMIVA